jgi:hypothetical protein
MSFQELCECVKAQYGNILSNNSYETPENLSLALEVIENNKGYKHKYQLRTYFILRACVKMPQLVFTVADIAAYSGLSEKQVTDCINRWIKFNFRYLTRLPKRGKGNFYRYRLRKHGTETYIALKHLIRLGFELNRLKYIPEKIDSYYYISKPGELKGLTEADLPEIDID